MPHLMYVYAAWAFCALVVWVLLFIAQSRVRREMLIISVLFALLGPGIYFHTFDYFTPPHVWGGWWGIEDVLIGFAYAGIAAALYEAVRGDHSVRLKRVTYWPILLAILLGSGVWMLVVPMFWLNSAYAFAILGLALGALLCIARPHLAPSALLSACLFTFAHSIFYVGFFALFPDALVWWKLENVSGTLLWGIPIEEFFWVFAWGFSVGPASELIARLPLPQWVEKRLMVGYIQK